MKDDSETPSSPEPHDTETLTTPMLAYTASGNLEAHSIVTWLQSNGVGGYAVEDNTGVSLFAFGTINQFHTPQVFVDKSNLQRASELLREFEAKRDQRQSDLENSPPIESECEECGATSEFPAFQDANTNRTRLSHFRIFNGLIKSENEPAQTYI